MQTSVNDIHYNIILFWLDRALSADHDAKRSTLMCINHFYAKCLNALSVSSQLTMCYEMLVIQPTTMSVLSTVTNNIKKLYRTIYLFPREQFILFVEFSLLTQLNNFVGYMKLSVLERGSLSA